MKDMHILLANVFFAPFTYGGATIVAEEVAQALVHQTGCRVSVVSVTFGQGLAPYTLTKSEKNGIANYLIHIDQNRSYAELYDNPQITALFGQLIDQLQPDVLHAHCLQDIGAGVLQTAKARGLPVVLSVHDFWWICDRQFMIRVNQRYCGQDPVRIENCRSCAENFSAARTRFDYLAAQAAYADVITYPSQFALNLSEASGFGPGKGVVWSNGVNMPKADFKDRQAARREKDPRLVFGFVGGPSQIKGWPLIREAFTGLPHSHFAGLVVDGSLDGSWWKGRTLKALSGNWQIHPRFSQSDMDDFYSKIDVLLFTSQWKETFGLAIREALARGIRVIQTDSGGTVEHGSIPAHKLIPIGAPSTELRQQIIEVLDEKPTATPSIPVTSFSDQARQLSSILNDLVP
ncbi:glycosyltransferase (plasmid) [Parasedimentitalea marina]|uniref:Glycosyltransferase n=1 Tax=Parasedimentitalea marina TaxID=2483033 RepID=A0A3T0N9D1_9RHOB|nr:glycosyltransferase family 4 protein [Parasedimentitalea marina]AZV80633.1 glycosyltransferase [Parasedimentitalea marina]